MSFDPFRDRLRVIVLLLAESYTVLQKCHSFLQKTVVIKCIAGSKIMGTGTLYKVVVRSFLVNCPLLVEVFILKVERSFTKNLGSRSISVLARHCFACRLNVFTNAHTRAFFRVRHISGSNCIWGQPSSCFTLFG